MMNGAKKNSLLIVDDEKLNIVALTRILMPEYAVYAAKNGREAIEVATEHAPDIILLDILMPEMDGYETLVALKSDDRTRAIPVIIVTGLDGAEAEEKGLALGAADYISKPFNPAIVKLKVQNQIKILNHTARLWVGE
jgi:CheY-like chemotaxis protein